MAFVIRWWNELEPERRPAPAELLDKMDTGRLAEAGMRLRAPALRRPGMGPP